MSETNKKNAQGSGDASITKGSVAASPRMQAPTAPVADSGQRRRSSTRSIKRKKFDDEVVESSLTPSQPKIEKLIKAKAAAPAPPPAPLPPPEPPQKASPATPSTPASSTTLSVSTPLATPVKTPSPVVANSPTSTPSSIAPSAAAANPTTSSVATSLPVPIKQEVKAPVASMVTNTVTSSATVHVTSHAVSASEARKRTKSKSRSKRTTKAPAAGSTKDLGRWKPQDDLLLINAVQQTCDLTAVFLGCKFTCRFTLREIQERWYALLYDPVLSKLAIQAMKQLHPDIVSQVDAKALFSRQEEKLLTSIPSNHFQNNQPNIETFDNLLKEQSSLFHPARTAKHIMNHWLLMRQYHLLPDQSVQPMPKGDHVLNFSDAEDLVNDEDLAEVKDDTLEQELCIADRRNKKEIRHLENELPRWQVLVDSVTGISPQEFDNQTLAVLRGRLVRYLMRSKEITLGRVTKDNTIDVDLSLEGPAWKISRRQGIIKLKNNGDFYLANEGKRRPVYIDGKPVMPACKHKLVNNSVVEISCLRFIFLINQDLVSMLRQGTPEVAPKLPT